MLLSEVVALRQFNHLYIYLDIAFLVLFFLLLLMKKKYMTLVVGALAGILYFVVDYCGFNLLAHSRYIEGGSMLWVLLWMSLSYGFTNFTWIWLWVRKDENLKLWTFLILLWWFVCPILASTFGNNQEMITIWRTTSSYHGYMALVLFVGYLGLIIWNLTRHDNKYKAPIFWLLAIGILVQFGWELGLLLGGIRSASFTDPTQKLETLIINSLLETNLGMPYIYLIYIAYTSRFTEELKHRSRPITLLEAIEENNMISLKNIDSKINI